MVCGGAQVRAVDDGAWCRNVVMVHIKEPAPCRPMPLLAQLQNHRPPKEGQIHNVERFQSEC